jgi:hypothetical protein
MEMSALAQRGAHNCLITLNFFGFSIPGKIIWRNKYYAGVRFKEKLSQTQLHQAIEKSGESVMGSGLQLNTTPCFSEGCRLKCPRHFPTELSTAPVSLGENAPLCSEKKVTE